VNAIIRKANESKEHYLSLSPQLERSDMVSGSAIGTLVVFILSIACVIYPFSFPILLPYLGRKKVHVNLTTAPIIAILVLWAAQCLGPRNVSFCQTVWIP